MPAALQLSTKTSCLSDRMRLRTMRMVPTQPVQMNTSIIMPTPSPAKPMTTRMSIWSGKQLKISLTYISA